MDLGERVVMSVGVGLAILPLLLWLVRLTLPIVGYVVLTIIFLLCLSHLYRTPIVYIAPSNFKHLTIILLLTSLHLAVFIYGAFQYTYLEDSDSIYHAVGAWKVARTGSTVSERYLEPYPPFYDIFMGLIVQLTGDIVLTLKVVNALIVSLGILFAYYAAREFVGSSAAVWVAFILAVLPSYLSHFIFAQSWALTIFWPAVYLMGKTVHNKNFWFILAFVMSGVFLVQPISSAVFLVYYLIFIVFQKSRVLFVKALLLAILLASTYWAYVFFVFGFSGVSNHLGFGMLTGEDTSGGIVYGLRDFVFATTDTRIDAPSGWGVMIFVLVLLGFFFKSPVWLFAWLVFGIIGIESNLFPVHFTSHRLWQFVAVPVVLLAGFSAHSVCSRFRNYWRPASIIIMALIISAAVPKFFINTSVWQRGPEWASYNEANGYSTLQKLGPGLQVFAPCSPDWKVVANNQVRVDAKVDAWNSSLILAQAKNLSADLLVFDESCVVQGFIDEKNLTNIINELLDNTVLVSKNPGFVAMSVANAK